MVEALSELAGALRARLRSMERWADTSSAAAAVVAGLCLAALVVYAVLNGSGHTGCSPYRLMWIFAPTAAVGMWACAAGVRRKHLSRPGTLALLAGLLGVGFLIFIDRADILLQYETWIARGMP